MGLVEVKGVLQTVMIKIMQLLGSQSVRFKLIQEQGAILVHGFRAGLGCLVWST